MRHPLTLILLGYFLLGILFSFIVPLNEAPDEADHFLYVQYLVENGRLPTMHPIATANATMEANQPPLFYALNALFLQEQDFSAPAHCPSTPVTTSTHSTKGGRHFICTTRPSNGPMPAPISPTTGRGSSPS